MTDPIRPVNGDYSRAGQLTPEQVQQFLRDYYGAPVLDQQEVG